MMIHFIRPYCLYALIPAALYLSWVMLNSERANPWRRVCDPHLLSVLVISNKIKLFWYHCLLILFVMLAIVAIAGPSWQKETTTVYRNSTTTITVLDLSEAMQVSDLKPDRLARAKFKIRDLINSNTEMQMGLIAFSGEAFVAMPISQDGRTLDILLEELEPAMMPIPGSDMGAGLDQALTLLAQTNISHGTILLITASDPSANSWKAANAIRLAGHRLDILAVMERSSETALIFDHLKQLAKMGGGSVHHFTLNSSDVDEILKHQKYSQLFKDPSIDKATLWSDGGPWICLILIPLALLLLREKAL